MHRDGMKQFDHPTHSNSPNNVHHAEIEKFNRIAASWWDKTGPFKPLHEINPLRLNYIESKAPLAGKRALDIGCGGGILSEAMAFRGAEVLGIDLAPDSIDAAKGHATSYAPDISSKLKLDYQTIAVETLAEQEPHSFDIITCMEMLEHVPSPEKIIQDTAALAKPGAHLFFSTLNRNPKSFLFAIVGAEYLLNLIPKGTHQYQSFIKPSELASMCRSVNLKIEHMVGISYNPITRFYRLSQNIDVNYIVYARKY
jgi:2-polyprenyl-6-hydroxyphenyl methylase / 3-demethylubiquinone-9 3-methyltransferase